jgi:hypothetical protein
VRVRVRRPTKHLTAPAKNSTHTTIAASFFEINPINVNSERAKNLTTKVTKGTKFYVFHNHSVVNYEPRNTRNTRNENEIKKGNQLFVQLDLFHKAISVHFECFVVNFLRIAEQLLFFFKFLYFVYFVPSLAPPARAGVVVKCFLPAAKELSSPLIP